MTQRRVLLDENIPRKIKFRPSNKYIDLLPLVETINQKMQEIREGEIFTISTR